MKTKLTNLTGLVRNIKFLRINGNLIYRGFKISLMTFLLLQGVIMPLRAQSDMIGCWPFDGNGNDLSGGNLHLTLFGSPGFAAGKFGQAIALDGTGNMYAQRLIDDAIMDFGNNDFTISIWVKYNSVDGEQVLIEKFSGSGGPGWTLTKVVWWDHQMHFYAQPAFWMVSDPIPIATNVWHHVVACREGTVIKVYFNGTLVTLGSGWGSGTIPDTYDPLLIGRRDYADGRIFGVNGMIDDVSIWSRCLNDSEISLLWNDGTGTPAYILLNPCLQSNLSVNAGSDATTYFGMPTMQEVIRTAAASGGTPPYTYNWSLGRPLLCNQVNAGGDELFYGGTCANSTCPTSGSPTETATCSGSETITAVLMDTTDICVTVTDANGCTATDCFTINASDIRCFSGNSGNQKVKICHLTNSNSNPWVEICVDNNAVDAHLAHGDFIGPCGASKPLSITGAEPPPGFSLFPNPAKNKVYIQFYSESGQLCIINLSDMSGRKLAGYNMKSGYGMNTIDLNLEGIEQGFYLVTLILDGKQELKKLMIE